MRNTKLIFLIGLIIAFIFVTGILIISLINQLSKSNEKNQGIDKSSLLFSLSEVSKHNSENDCWMIIDNKVYDVTSYFNSHPGGTNELLKGCGKDATTLYDTKDKNPGVAHSETARSLFSSYYIGDLNSQITNSGPGNSSQMQTNPKIPAVTPTGVAVTLNLEEISKHNSIQDCWMIINNKVYDVTSYFNSHPGGTNELLKGCGKDATTLYDTKGSQGQSHSSNANSLLNPYYIGDFNQKITASQLQNRTSTIENTTLPGNYGEEDEREEYEDD